MNALSKIEGGAIAAPQVPTFSLAPRNLEEAFRLADMLADSDLVPKDFRSKPGNCLIAIQWGSEIGLKPLQALQNIAVINGRPCLLGDALIALVRSSPLCEYVIESMEGTTAVCRVKRRGEAEQIRSFSEVDAKTAGLAGKQGPWQTNPSRMKQMRARAFALRDVFPDVLKGISVAEEVMDYVDMPASAPPPPPPPPAPINWPAEAFVAQFPRWEKAVHAGLKTTDDILALARSKGGLTPEQESQIRAIKPPPKTEDTGPSWGDDSAPVEVGSKE